MAQNNEIIIHQDTIVDEETMEKYVNNGVQHNLYKI